MNSPADTDDPGPMEEPGEAERRARVEKALDTVRDILTPDELEEHRRMLLSLARTHPALSSWIEDQRPRAVPDESGTVQKRDSAALQAAAARRTGSGRGHG